MNVPAELCDYSVDLFVS